jgi:hypothetical protein
MDAQRREHVGEAFDRMNEGRSSVARAGKPQEVLLADRKRHAAKIMRDDVAARPTR